MAIFEGTGTLSHRPWYLLALDELDRKVAAWDRAQSLKDPSLHRQWTGPLTESQSRTLESGQSFLGGQSTGGLVPGGYLPVLMALRSINANPQADPNLAPYIGLEGAAEAAMAGQGARMLWGPRIKAQRARKAPTAAQLAAMRAAQTTASNVRTRRPTRQPDPAAEAQARAAAQAEMTPMTAPRDRTYLDAIYERLKDANPTIRREAWHRLLAEPHVRQRINEQVYGKDPAHPKVSPELGATIITDALMATEQANLPPEVSPIDYLHNTALKQTTARVVRKAAQQARQERRNVPLDEGAPISEAQAAKELTREILTRTQDPIETFDKRLDKSPLEGIPPLLEKIAAEPPRGSVPTHRSTAARIMLWQAQNNNYTLKDAAAALGISPKVAEKAMNNKAAVASIKADILKYTIERAKATKSSSAETKVYEWMGITPPQESPTPSNPGGSEAPKLPPWWTTKFPSLLKMRGYAPAPWPEQVPPEPPLTPNPQSLPQQVRGGPPEKGQFNRWNLRPPFSQFFQPRAPEFKVQSTKPVYRPEARPYEEPPPLQAQLGVPPEPPYRPEPLGPGTDIAPFGPLPYGSGINRREPRVYERPGRLMKGGPKKGSTVPPPNPGRKEDLFEADGTLRPKFEAITRRQLEYRVDLNGQRLDLAVANYKKRAKILQDFPGHPDATKMRAEMELELARIKRISLENQRIRELLPTYVPPQRVKIGQGKPK